jgi:DNA-binding transcriptional MerR regulator
MTAAGPASGTDDDRELTVDELAARVGVTVRNLRAYAARGLLPPPRMVGRTGYYGREHVARLLLVREMLAEGFSLAMIERTLASAPPTASSATLALHRALLAPWLPPEPEETTGPELAARAGVPENSALVEQLKATVVRLQPVAAQALLAVFRTEMAAAVSAALSTELSRLEERE